MRSALHWNSLRDGRGTPRPLVRVEEIAKVVGGLEGVEFPMNLRTAREAARGRRFTRASIVGCVLCLVVSGVINELLLTVAESSAASQKGWLENTAQGTMVIGIIGAFATAVFLTRSTTREEVQAIVRRCGRCLVCGYELRGLKQEADGCKVCPECSAAWRD